MSLLTVKQAADRLAVSEKTVRREVACGRLPITEIAGCIRIREVDLESYVERNTRCHIGPWRDWYRARYDKEEAKNILEKFRAEGQL